MSDESGKLPGGRIDASIALRSGDKFLVGRDRLRLLEAVSEHGNITHAARAVGLSYKTAWDAVNAINNLLPSPAFVTRTGGSSGGGAEVTPEGKRLIETFRRLESRLTQISELIAKEGLEGQEEALLWMLGARISARNIFQCEVLEVQRGPVKVLVTLKVSEHNLIQAAVTNSAVTGLGLTPGRKALALIKAPFVRLEASGEKAPDSTNRFSGTVLQRTDDSAQSEVLLDIGRGKTMTAIVPRAEADRLRIAAGVNVVATFEPDFVILAVN